MMEGFLAKNFLFLVLDSRNRNRNRNIVASPPRLCHILTFASSRINSIMFKHSLLMMMGVCFLLTVLFLIQRSKSFRIRYDVMTRISLQTPDVSALPFLLQSEVDTAYIRCFGFDVTSFNVILSPFATDFSLFTFHPSCSRLRRLAMPSRSHRKVSPKLCLDLVLAFYRSQAEQHVLCLVSGIIPSNCSWDLTFGHLLLNVRKFVPKNSIYVSLSSENIEKKVLPK